MIEWLNVLSHVYFFVSSTFSFSKLEVFQSARGIWFFSPRNSFSVQWGFPNVCLSQVFFNIFGCPEPFLSAAKNGNWMNYSAWFLETTIICQNIGSFPIFLSSSSQTCHLCKELINTHEYITGMTLVRSSHPELLTTSLHIFSIYLLNQKSFLFHELWHPRKTNPISVVPQFFLMSSYESLFAHEIQ